MVEKHSNMQYGSNLDHTRHEKSSKPSATRLSLKIPLKVSNVYLNEQFV